MTKISIDASLCAAFLLDEIRFSRNAAFELVRLHDATKTLLPVLPCGSARNSGNQVGRSKRILPALIPIPQVLLHLKAIAF